MRARTLLVLLLSILGPACSGGGGGGGKKPSASTPPEAPTELAASPGDEEVQLAWRASAGAESYRVYQGASAGFSPGPGQLVATTASTGVLLTGLRNGVKRWFAVTALNAHGESPPSARVSATPDESAANLPPVPRSLGADVHGSEVTLYWSASAGATSYHVYLDTRPGVRQIPGNLVANVLTNGVTLSGLLPGVRVFVAVSAVSSVGESALSSEISVVPAGAGPGGASQPPPTPTGLRASVQGSTIHLVWSGSREALGYRLYYGTTSGVRPSPSGYLGWVSSTSGTLSNVAAGSRLHLVVTAFNDVGESGPSNEVLVQIGGAGSGAAPRGGLYRGTWDANLFDSEVELGYLDASNAILMEYVVEGHNFFGTPCSTLFNFTRPHPIAPDYSFAIVLQGADGDDEILGRFTSTTQVVGQIVHRNDNYSFGCNPPAHGPFAAVWVGTGRRAGPDAGEAEVRALPIPGLPSLRLVGAGRPSAAGLPDHLRALYP